MRSQLITAIISLAIGMTVGWHGHQWLSDGAVHDEQKDQSTPADSALKKSEPHNSLTAPKSESTTAAAPANSSSIVDVDAEQLEKQPEDANQETSLTDSQTVPLDEESIALVQEYISTSDSENLAHLLGHESDMIRLHVIEGLGLIGDEKSVQYLGQVLFSDDSQQNRIAAIHMLESLNYFPQSNHFLATVQQSDPDSDVRRAAAQALGLN